MGCRPGPGVREATIGNPYQLPLELAHFTRVALCGALMNIEFCSTLSNVPYYFADSLTDIEPSPYIVIQGFEARQLRVTAYANGV